MGTILMVVCLATFLSAACWADDHGSRKGRNRPADMEGQGDDLQRLQATIEKKSLETITTNTGEKFALSENTIIVHTDGQQVSTRDMLVPCDAEIGYRMDNGVRTAERITIKQVGANATWHWTSERSE